MSDAAFDPYYQWLGIPPRHQPPDHYRLLGIESLEVNPTVIDQAADRQMAHLRTHQSGAHAHDAARLLNEVSTARVCLLNTDAKRDYDRQLKSKNDGESPAAKPAAPPRKRIKTAQPIAASADVATRDQAPHEPMLKIQTVDRRPAGPVASPAWMGPALIGGIAIGGVLLVAIVGLVVLGSFGAREVPANVARLDENSAPPAKPEDGKTVVPSETSLPDLPQPTENTTNREDVPDTNADVDIGASTGQETAFPSASAGEPAGPYAVPNEDLMKRIGPSIVSITSSQGSSTEGGCGFIVGPYGIVATSSELVGEGKRVRVILKGGQEAPLERVLAVHPECGIAFLQTQRPDRPMPVLPLATAVPDEGDPLFVVSGTRTTQTRWSPKVCRSLSTGEALRQELNSNVTANHLRRPRIFAGSALDRFGGKKPIPDGATRRRGGR